MQLGRTRSRRKSLFPLEQQEATHSASRTGRGGKVRGNDDDDNGDDDDDDEINHMSETKSRDGKLHDDEEDEDAKWLCALCTKANEERAYVCEVCKRPRGYMPSTATLPFHPPCKTVVGASRFLDRTQIRALLEAGADPNSVDSEGWAGMHWAAALGRLDLVDLYMAHDADINLQRQDGYSPLHVACEIGDEETALYLLQRGAKSELRTRYDQFTPLHLACREGHRRCIEALGLAGADLNAQSTVSGFTPLMIAAIAGHDECVMSLLLVSMDTLRQCQNLEPLNIDLLDNDGFAAIDLAILREHHKVVEVLKIQFAKATMTL